MSRPKRGIPPKPLSRARERARASWIFSSILLAALLTVVWLAPERLAGFKQQIVALFAALLAGFMAYFLTGDLGIQRSWLRASGGMGAFALLLFVWPRLAPAPGPDIYRLRVTVLGLQGQPVEDAEVRSSVGGEQKRVQGGWEVEIPASGLPADHKVTVYADKPSAFLHGSREVVLEKDFQPAVPVKLKEDRSARASGTVEDGEGRTLARARVWVLGFEAEAVTTSREGGFDLAAHAAPGQTVRLHAEKAGFLPLDQDGPAGPAITLQLSQR
ncbi:MAG TPA: carboxypeptidase-like regulatory domain-containing protein [Thermoanaerobaculia bacterium]